MSAYSCIFCALIAVILVAVKLILEHQRDQDRRNGTEQDADAYTMRGMLRLIREEHRAKKEEELEARKRAREKRRNPQDSETQELSVRKFNH